MNSNERTNELAQAMVRAINERSRALAENVRDGINEAVAREEQERAYRRLYSNDADEEGGPTVNLKPHTIYKDGNGMTVHIVGPIRQTGDYRLQDQMFYSIRGDWYSSVNGRYLHYSEIRPGVWDHVQAPAIRLQNLVEELPDEWPWTP